MPSSAQIVRIFAASPNEVSSEREHLARVVADINLTLSAIVPERGIVLELLRWETHAAPGLGRDAQDVVNRHIGRYEIFIGILWKRFGTPTAVADSGTQEEFDRAHAMWKENPAVEVMFYFCQAPFPPPKSNDEVAQLSKVISFKDELSAKGLVWEYPDSGSFADVVRRHLILIIGRMLSGAASPSEAAKRSAGHSESDLETVREQVHALAREYERLRETMPSGQQRTRAMSAIAARMRQLALAAYPLVPDLSRSALAGDRLAAVSALAEIPNPEYLVWLASRVGIETPFLGYQATKALLQAARLLGEAHATAVSEAVAMAQELMTNLAFQDPNQVHMLENAARTLNQRTESR
jgi:hypothetical protein